MRYDRIPAGFDFPYQRFNKMYAVAKEEHAFLLRCEGLKYREIGEHFGGLSRERVRQLVCRGARRLQHAMKRTKVYYVDLES